MEAIGTTAGIISIAALARDIAELAFTFQDTIKQVSASRREHVGLANRIINCMENLIQSPSSQEVPRGLKPNMMDLQSDLQIILNKCSDFDSPRSSVKAWVMREHISKAIEKLKTDFDLCLQIFSAMSTLRLEYRLSELHDIVNALANRLETKLKEGDADTQVAEALVRTNSMDRKTLKRSLRRAKRSLTNPNSRSMERKYLALKIKTVGAALVRSGPSGQEVCTPPGLSSDLQTSGPEDPFLDALELVRDLRSPSPSLPPNVIAIRLDNLSVILSDTGDYEGASFVSTESVKLLRSLDPLSTRPALATALHNRANHLRSIDIRQALFSSNQAVLLFEDLHEEDHVYLSRLALALNTLANCHQKAGNYSKAIRTARSVVDIQQRLFKDDPELFAIDLAMSLNNLAAKLRRIDPRGAHNMAREACDIFRAQVSHSPDLHSPEYATALTNYSTCLVNLGDYATALVHTREAARMRHTLSGSQPSVYVPQFAENLHDTFEILSLLNQDHDADIALHLAIDSYRRLVEEHPQRHHAPFTFFLRDIARSLLRFQRHYDALSLLRESLPVFARMAGESPSHIGKYISVLDDLASCSRHLNMVEDAAAWSRYADTGRLCLKFLDCPSSPLVASGHGTQ